METWKLYRDMETHGDMETLHVQIHMETLRHMET